MTKQSSLEIFKFAAVGSVGFVVEAIVLTFLVAEGLGAYVSRAISFPIALSVTWYLNRRHTFECGKYSRFESLKTEYLIYLLLQSLGALLNISVFSGVVFALPQFKSLPIVPLAIGSGVAMFFNFSCSKHLVYGRKGGDGI